MSDKAAEKQLCELVYSDSRVGLGYEAGDLDINDMEFKSCDSQGVSVQYGPHSHQTALACPKHRFVLDDLRREFPE
jgi:hypothetical protein